MPRERLTYTEHVKLRQIHSRRSAYGEDTPQTLTERHPPPRRQAILICSLL
jgi:hypothetical protein